MVDTCYISTSCNRVPNCLDWGYNNLICYGACNAVAIYNPKISSNSGTICRTFAEHTGRINCVRWIKPNDQGHEFEFIATSSDKTASIWRKLPNSRYDYALVSRLVGHNDIVNTCSAVYDFSEKDDDDRQQLSTIIATASSDSTIKIWKRERGSDDVSCIQTIDLKSHFALDLRLSHHPITFGKFLIYGGSDTKIHVLVEQRANELIEVLSLIGHEDWIRGIDITLESSGDLLIASCAQDCFIRLWRLSRDCENKEEFGDQTIKLKKQSYIINSSEKGSLIFHVSLEAVLAGHENSVYGVHWHHPSSKGAIGDQPMKLLSSSMDKTMILWELDESLGVWTEKVRVGEVGGNTLGIYGSKIGPDGLSILAHGYQGAFHMWNFDTEVEQWRPAVTVGGHFDEVLDLDWDPKGQFLISVSCDQTARLHAPWTETEKPQSWYEMARPQVHGYDMTCVAMVGRTKFASGADEKVLRAFEAPKNFAENLERLSGVNLMDDSTLKATLPEGASVPSLGLSNKAVFEKRTAPNTETKHPKDIYPESYFESSTLTQPPTEENLLQNTLWPEVHKMYGHGNEIFCVSASRNGLLLASACKASKADHAGIIIWSTLNWKEIGRLTGPSLTITQMQFSPCDSYLLAVSRDRTWSLFSVIIEDEKFVGLRIAYTDKSTCIHGRIIWTCAWSTESKCFATGSRDKKVIIWTDRVENKVLSCLGKWKAISNPLTLEDSVTALDFSPILTNDSYMLAVGLDNGTVHIYQLLTDYTQCGWTKITTFSNSLYHHLTVKRLRFRPLAVELNSNEDHEHNIVLASCGSDNAVYIFKIQAPILNIE